MIKLCLMKLGLKWILSHKSRYIFNWISFALVSVVLICIFSLSTRIRDSVTKQISVNPIYCQAHIKNEQLVDGKIESNLTVDRCSEIAEKLGASQMRILYDTFLSVRSMDGVPTDKAAKTAAFHVEYPLMLDSEMSAGTNAYIGSVRAEQRTPQAVVTFDFLAQYGWDSASVIGKSLVLTNENEQELSIPIVAVIQNLEAQSLLNSASVYLTYNPSVDSLFGELSPATVTFDLPREASMSDVENILEGFGYPYSIPSTAMEKMIAIADTYSRVGSILGVFMILICCISIINSVIITINENSAFMNMFRLMGLTAGNHRMLICFITSVQGLIGGILGFVASLLTQKTLCDLIRDFNPMLSNGDTSDFRVDLTVSVVVMVVCVAASVLAGLISLAVTSKKTTITMADSELV